MPGVQLTSRPGIKLLGFKSRKDLAFEDNIKHSLFIYPDEMVRSPSNWHSPSVPYLFANEISVPDRFGSVRGIHRPLDVLGQQAHIYRSASNDDQEKEDCNRPRADPPKLVAHFLRNASAGELHLDRTYHQCSTVWQAARQGPPPRPVHVTDALTACAAVRPRKSTRAAGANRQGSTLSHCPSLMTSGPHLWSRHSEVGISFSSRPSRA